MKKFVTLAVLASLSLSAFAAQTDSDDLKLKGKVPKAVSIIVSPELQAMDLDLRTSPTTRVASVKEISNSVDGYKITVDSINDGELVNQQDNTQSVPYSMTYDGEIVDLTDSNFEVKNVTSGGLINYDSDVFIGYLGKPHEERVSGNYTDTVTFTISAN